MILVDTSAWIDFFRGRGVLSSPVDRLLEVDEVAVCGPILTEIRRGLIRPRDRARVLGLLTACPVLDEPRDLWDEAGDLGAAVARRGVVAKTLDLLIATYALAHRVPLLTRDADFERMRAAGIPLDLVHS